MLNARSRIVSCSIIFLAICIPALAPAFAAEPMPRITSPTVDQRVKGPLTFTIDAANEPGVASVEWLLNGMPLSGPITVPPYSYAWHSAFIWDGPAAVQAVVRGAAGKVLAIAGPVPFYVDNSGGVMRMVSPDPAAMLRGEALAGTVNWSLAADRPMTPDEEAKIRASHGGRVPIEAMMFFIDGKDFTITWRKDSPTVKLETEKLANGRHVLYATAWASPQGNPAVAAMQYEVMVNNGHALRGVRPRWAEVFLAPGQKIALEPRAVYTDGVIEPLDGRVDYACADPAVASVSPEGEVTAIAPGATSVSIKAKGFECAARVVVTTLEGLPHFSRDGKLITRYDAKQSMFVRSLFGFGPQEVERSKPLAEQAHAAAINTLTTGFYHNPADGSNPPDFEAFRKAYEPWWETMEKPARENDFCLLFTGDDICRTPNEMANSVGNAWSAQAVQLVFTKARDSGRAVCVEMVDEISFLWGDTPTPTDGRWKKKDHPLDDDGFVRLLKIINAVDRHPPITWPIGGISSNTAAKNWMGNPAFSDYATLYWDTFAWRRAYPQGMSLPQMKEALDRVGIGRYPVIQRERPIMLLMSICGPWYGHDGAGKQFTGEHLKAYLDTGGTAISEASQVMYAAAKGMAGIRAYNFDNESWKREREKGAGQTGSDPFEVGTNRWAGMSAAFNLVSRLEPYLLQKQINAIDLGPLITTGARESDASRLLIAASYSELPEAARVDLSPYRYADGKAAPVVRYRLAGATLRTERAPDRGDDAVTFTPGESIVWLLRPLTAGKEKADVTPPSVQITSPLPDSTIANELSLAVKAEDDTAVSRVEILVDGKGAAVIVLDAEQAKAQEPGLQGFRMSTAGLRAGVWHTITAVARDAAGNSGEARMMVHVVAP